MWVCLAGGTLSRVAGRGRLSKVGMNGGGSLNRVAGGGRRLSRVAGGGRLRSMAVTHGGRLGRVAGGGRLRSVSVTCGGRLGRGAGDGGRFSAGGCRVGVRIGNVAFSADFTKRTGPCEDADVSHFDDRPDKSWKEGARGSEVLNKAGRGRVGSNLLVDL